MKKNNKIKKDKIQFNANSVGKMVFSEALQHPFTLYPAALSILGGLYMALINFDKTSFSVTAVATILSSLSFVFQYFIKGEDRAKKIVKDKISQLKEEMVNEWISIKDKMLTNGFAEGAKEVQELHQSFIRLVTFLNEKFRDKGSLTAERFIVLAEETYSRGIFLLQKALEVYSALNEIDEQKLKDELVEFEKKLKISKKHKDSSAIEQEALEIKIKSHSKRIQLFTERADTLRELMAQCEVLEATLDSTYLEVVDLITYDSKTELTQAESKLEKAVASARKAEQRIRGLNSFSNEKDSIYLMDKKE